MEVDGLPDVLVKKEATPREVSRFMSRFFITTKFTVKGKIEE